MHKIYSLFLLNKQNFLKLLKPYRLFIIKKPQQISNTKLICRLSAIAMLFSICCFNTSCHSGKTKEVLRDTSITYHTSYNNLFFDSMHLQAFLDTNPDLQKFTTQYNDFYKQRNFEYAWFDSTSVAEQAANFMNLLNNSITHLQDSSLYNKKLVTSYNEILQHKNKVSRQNILNTELLLTGQFFAYAAQTYKGSDIDATTLGWFIPRKKVDLTALLDSTIKYKNAAPYIPLNNQYNQLESFLEKYISLQKNYPTDSIPCPSKLLKLYQANEIIPTIKYRLFLLGDLSHNDSTNLFDSSLLIAVKHFQKRMGLLEDGVIGKNMIEQLNVPIAERIRQILVNLERIRWMPADSDSDYIIVNIPEYKLHVYHDGKTLFNMNVIVGKTTNNTVIFNGKLKYIVFSPYWNVPPSIVQKEILPGMKKDPNYLAKNNMEITGTNNGLPIVRQKPGPGNSLGLVKFLFPNNFDIYLHDTPNHELFDATTRTFSHGCIRISNPKKFAQYLLSADTASVYTNKVIDSLMHLSKEKWVSLPQPIPVYIVYFTAWVDADGQLNFRKDIYGHDARMKEKLFMKQEKK
ncbi:L,D-transpeptidase family protein [Hydrotalea sp.]|uniref:L,D-transpeptidase family protein n=1 Tax=Hydrotalea sp. TaxID=2881279 RepID=UPI002583ECCC|nr:L,D-transpeptidase family protein [Hydrotalea sp.]